MKTFLGLLVFFLQFLFSESPLSERYHTYDEIDSLLHLWNDEFGQTPDSSPYSMFGSGIVYKLIEIGTSTRDELPFWAVKLSFNADVDEDEPRSLILGQCHAEEILGVEIAMDLIYMFLHPNEFQSELTTLTNLLYSSEIWIVPTYNPEGLGVVHGYEENGEWIQDVSFRKNKMDANHNGEFDFDTNGYGNDIDGVDLNRNYGFNWIFGDEFLETDEGCSSNPSYVSNYDYFRGESPFSEDETIAIRDLALEYDFILSIAYHSSRSGCVAERVIFPWTWGGTKTSPDYSVIQPLGQQIAELTSAESGSGNYHFAGSSSPKGNAHDWFYKETGSIQYLIEVGTADMQPDNIELIEDTIQRNLPGAFYLMKRAAGINNPTGPDKHQVTGTITDFTTGAPIEGVEVVVNSMNGGVLSPRLTDHFGRYRRLLSANSYDLVFKKSGYENFAYSGYTPSADYISPLNIEMTPKQHSTLTLNLEVPTALEGDIVLALKDEDNIYEYSLNSTELSISIPNGDYLLEINADNIYPHIEHISVYENAEIEIDLHRHNILFYEDFEDLGNWELVNGDWSTEDGCLLSQSNLIYPNWSPSGDLRLDSEEYFSFSYPEVLLQLDMKYEVEWDSDTLFINLFNDDSNQRILSKTDQMWENTLYNIPLDIDFNQQWKIGMGIIRDYNIGFRGVSVENLKIIESCIAGDVNHDASLDVTDIVLSVDVILGNDLALNYILCNIDSNEDLVVDILDVIKTLNKILGV